MITTNHDRGDVNFIQIFIVIILSVYTYYIYFIFISGFLRWIFILLDHHDGAPLSSLCIALYSTISLKYLSRCFHSRLALTLAHRRPLSHRESSLCHGCHSNLIPMSILCDSLPLHLVRAHVSPLYFSCDTHVSTSPSILLIILHLYSKYSCVLPLQQHCW